MNFFVRGYNQSISADISYPCFFLVSDSWDDYGNKTTFVLQYYTETKQRIIIGALKIMDVNNEETGGRTVLNSSFESLDENVFCSLGSNTQYYRRLKELETVIDVKAVLESLNDIAFLPGLRAGFEHTKIFINSLIREREAKSAFLLGGAIINEQNIGPKVSFTFSTKLKDADSAHIVNFEFQRDSEIPRRVFSIVGKNGTGKTQFLANLSNALGYSKKKQLPAYETGFFDTEIGPPFSKIIALSYSIFDVFRRPKPSKHFSYVYCGIRGDNDEIDKRALFQRHIASLKQINKFRLNETWFNSIKNLVDLSSIGYKTEEWFHEITNIEEIESSQTLNLSSGQSILLYTLTELIAHITENSLILFDEPETHLHPNAIAQLVNVISDIATKFNSFVIISTHSPIVIQEIPAKNVWIFERDGNTPITRPLDIESYGENLTIITEHIFETSEIKDRYKEALRELATHRSYQEILQIFENRLSLNAKIFLSGLYNNESS